MTDQPTPPTPPPDASGEQRLDLALRLLTMQYGVASDHLRLSPGKLPDDLPFELPLPAGAHVLGALSVAREPAEQESAATRRVLHTLRTIMLVELPLTEEQGAQALSERLETAGWGREFMPHMRGGFVHVMPSHNFMRFRAASGDDVLIISPLPGASAQTTAFSLAAHQEPPPFSDQHHPDTFRDLNELIPPLLPPPGATQQSGGGGGGNGSRYSSASLTTSAPIAEVMANYDPQLERGGWRRRSGGVSGSVGWSYWSFSDDEQKAWRGALAVLGDPERPRDYLALIQIDSGSRDDGGFAGWKSHSIIGG
jgi:hypothetical protein